MLIFEVLGVWWLGTQTLTNANSMYSSNQFSNNSTNSAKSCGSTITTAFIKHSAMISSGQVVGGRNIPRFASQVFAKKAKNESIGVSGAKKWLAEEVGATEDDKCWMNLAWCVILVASFFYSGFISNYFQKNM